MALGCFVVIGNLKHMRNKRSVRVEDLIKKKNLALGYFGTVANLDHISKTEPVDLRNLIKNVALGCFATLENLKHIRSEREEETDRSRFEVNLEYSLCWSAGISELFWTTILVLFREVSKQFTVFLC